jgi:hypothetical protein
MLEKAKQRERRKKPTQDKAGPESVVHRRSGVLISSGR